MDGGREVQLMSLRADLRKAWCERVDSVTISSSVNKVVYLGILEVVVVVGVHLLGIHSL